MKDIGHIISFKNRISKELESHKPLKIIKKIKLTEKHIQNFKILHYNSIKGCQTWSVKKTIYNIQKSTT